MIFDTHAHVISADIETYPPSQEHKRGAVHPFDAAALIAAMDEGGVARACAVQRGRYYGWDNSYCLEAARLYPDRLSPVIMLDTKDPGTPDELRRLAGAHTLGAFRLCAPNITTYDTSWMNGPVAMQAWETACELRLPVCIIFFVRHRPYALPALKLIAEMFPELTIVIDHVGVPHATVHEDKWMKEHGVPLPHLGAPDYGILPAMKDLRPCRNVYYKFTGINLERLEANDVEPARFIRRFVDEFGADHLMWGSDMGQTKGPYSRLVGEAREATRLLDEAEREQVLHGVANGLFGAGLTG